MKFMVQYHAPVVVLAGQEYPISTSLTLNKAVLLTGLLLHHQLDDVDEHLLADKLVTLFSTQSMVSDTVECVGG